MFSNKPQNHSKFPIKITFQQPTDKIADNAVTDDGSLYAETTEMFDDNDANVGIESNNFNSTESYGDTSNQTALEDGHQLTPINEGLSFNDNKDDIVENWKNTTASIELALNATDVTIMEDFQNGTKDEGQNDTSILADGTKADTTDNWQISYGATTETEEAELTESTSNPYVETTSEAIEADSIESTTDSLAKDYESLIVDGTTEAALVQVDTTNSNQLDDYQVTTHKWLEEAILTSQGLLCIYGSKQSGHFTLASAIIHIPFFRLREAFFSNLPEFQLAFNLI